MNKKKILIFGSIPVLIAVVAIVVLLLRHHKTEPVVMTGLIETVQVNASSLLPGRIDSLWVGEGDEVQKGQILATMDTRILDAKLGQAEGLAKSAASLAELARKGTREERKLSAQNQYNIAKANYDFAEATYERYRALYEDSIISLQEMEAVQTRYVAAKEQLSIASNLYAIALKGMRPEEINAAEGQEEAAAGMTEEAKALRDETIIRSPVTGVIADQMAEEGEVVGLAYPVFTVIQPQKNYALLQVREDMMKYFKKGSKHKIRLPALGNEEVEVEVHHISVLADFATWEPTQMKGDYNLKSFEVHLVPEKPVKDWHAGMTFQLEIYPEEGE
jgi:HlyD family secretion protein